LTGKTEISVDHKRPFEPGPPIHTAIADSVKGMPKSMANESDVRPDPFDFPRKGHQKFAYLDSECGD
jgi:hypothetical protein